MTTYPFGILPGIEYSRAPAIPVHILISSTDSNKLPAEFPLREWNDQSVRYLHYWQWFRGDYLMELRGKTPAGENVVKFPLGINPVRNFSRKHAAILLGEETFDSPQPLVKIIATPKLPFSGDEPSEEDKKSAKTFENIVNEVWQSNGGRTLQTENAILTQFLGGCVFGLKWDPDRDDLTIPIALKSYPVDFFLPVWSTKNYWNLLSAFIVYSIPVAVAREEYGYAGSAMFIIYCEHWTAEKYSIYINGEPISVKGITYKDVPNPFGFVPFVYIPHIKEGSSYGSSIVEDIHGLVKEFNARLADTGDAIRLSIKRNRYLTNAGRDIKSRTIGNNIEVVDLGNTLVQANEAPKVDVEDPPDMSSELVTFPEKALWKQLLREASLGDIAFGEDEGSQRSALTLAFRMYPATSHARVERTFWTEGLTQIAKMIWRMLVVKGKALKILDKPLNIDPDMLKKIQIGADWKPMIPRDREQMVSEITLRVQSGTMSTRKAIEDFGDVRNVDDEIKQIEEDMKRGAAISQPQNNSEKGAPTKVETPVAEAIVGDG